MWREGGERRESGAHKQWQQCGQKDKDEDDGEEGVYERL